MHIAHITATFPPNRTGTGNVAYHNAIELARRGHQVHVFTARAPDMPAHETLHGVEVHRLSPLVRYGNAPLLPGLFSQLRNIEIVHLHMPFYGGAEAILLLHRLKHMPLFITHHQDVKLSGIPGLINRVHDRTLGRALMCRADRACFTSIDYGQSSQFAPLIASHKLRAAELPNGVDVERFVPAEPPPELRARYAPAGQKVVLFVGVLDRAHYFKGVNILLQALAQLHRDDTALVVVGKGNMLEEYRQQALQLGIEGQVHFAGFVPDEELPDYYRLADMTVLPSTTEGEAFGLVLVESMACGTPVIASALPGVRTVVADGQDGFRVEPGNQADLVARLTTMLAMPPEQRRAMGQAGRAKVEARYAWTQIGALLDSLYTEALQERTHIHRVTAASSTHPPDRN